MKILLWTVALLATAWHPIRAQDASLDDLLKEIFDTGNNPTPVQPAASGNPAPTTPLVRPPPVEQPFTNPPTNGNQGSSPVQNQRCSGECVPVFLCNNNQLVTDGAGLIDIRIDVGDEERECPDYLEVCCEAGQQLPVPVTPAPNVMPQKQGCGHRNSLGVAYRISGGKDNEAEFGEFPWMVAVLREERGPSQTLNTYQCGGSLIHQNVVLTAAHCVSGKDATTLKIRAGEWDTQTKNEVYQHQDRDVARIVIHPQFVKSNLVNDVALLILSEPVQMDPHISTVCLPPQNANFDYSRCVASGWGKDVFGREGKYQVILKKIDMPVVPFAQCQSALRTTRLGRRFQLSQTFMCAGGELGKDTCKGDGGSPLICPIDGQPDRFYQSGIVAWGIGCGENQIPGVYVNVAKFRNWVDSEMRRLNYDTSVYTAY